jgi:DNA-directed RNA polymerase specialized sigma24 family protein
VVFHVSLGIIRRIDETSVSDWELLHAQMGRSVRGKILRLLRPSGNSSSLDDVCQQFWMHLWKVGPAYWTSKGVNLISKQITFKWLRKQKHPPTFSLIDRLDGDEHFGEKNTRWKEPLSEMSALVPDASKIAALLTQLPGEQRAVFSFRYQLHGHEELTFREIGERMGITIGQAAYLFYQAQKNIKAMLNT